MCHAIEESLEEAKQKIYKEFHGSSKNGCPRASIKEAKKIISDFKKLPVTDENTIELMVCYVSDSLYFIREYGAGYGTNYPDSAYSMFETVLKLISKNQLKEKYPQQMEQLIKASENSYVYDFDWLYDKYLGEK